MSRGLSHHETANTDNFQAINSLEEAQNMSDDLEVGESEANELTSLVSTYELYLNALTSFIAQRSYDLPRQLASRR